MQIVNIRRKNVRFPEFQAEYRSWNNGNFQIWNSKPQTLHFFAFLSILISSLYFSRYVEIFKFPRVFYPSKLMIFKLGYITSTKK